MNTILVVEDEKDIRIGLQEMLENEEFIVICATNGKEGLDLAVSKQPDMILSDILMPQMDGFEMLNKLQGNPITATIPVIFLTAKVEHQDYRKGMMIGADDYIVKPFKIDDVLSAIKTRLRKRENYKSVVENFKNALIKKVPHELRTPLIGILGFSEIIENDADDLTNEEVKKMAKKIRSSGKRLQRRIEKFLIYAELSSLSKEKLSTNSLLFPEYDVDPEYLKTLLNYKASGFGREEDLSLCFEEGKIKISATYFEMVLDELIENSTKFSQTGSTIKISGSSNDRYYITKITDHSAGIIDSNKNKIVPFNHLENENTFKEGLGFGLAIVKSIIDLHNGYLKIESVKGKSTNVEFGIPFAITVEN